MEMVLIFIILAVAIMYVTTQICDVIREIFKKDKKKVSDNYELKRNTRQRRYTNYHDDK